MRREFVAPAGEKKRRMRRSYKLENGVVKSIFNDSDEDLEGLCQNFDDKCEDTNETDNRKCKRTMPLTIKEEDEIQVKSRLKDPYSDDKIEVKDSIIIHNNIKREAECFENESLLDPYTGELFKEEEFESLQNTNDDDLHKCKDHILSYIHKKFNKRFNSFMPDNSQSSIQGLGIENVLVVCKEETEMEVSLTKNHPPPPRERKSVIVVRESVIKKTKAMTDENKKMKHDASKLVLSFNINELETIYTMEEEKYFEEVFKLFDEKWNGTCLDEQTMEQTIYYSETGISENVPMQYFQTLNFYLR